MSAASNIRLRQRHRHELVAAYLLPRHRRWATLLPPPRVHNVRVKAVLARHPCYRSTRLIAQGQHLRLELRRVRPDPASRTFCRVHLNLSWTRCCVHEASGSRCRGWTLTKMVGAK